MTARWCSTRCLVPAALALLVAAVPVAAQTASRAIVFGASVGLATSLTLSSSTLDVPAVNGGEPTVVGIIDVQASARTRTAGEVVLTVEALRDIDQLAGGASHGVVTIDYASTADGMVDGLLTSTPQVAGRWIGSGTRRGQLVFTARGPGYLRGGVIPLRFVLSTP